MTYRELKEIRERKSLESAHLKGQALRDYFAKGANKFLADVEEIRKQKALKEQQEKKTTAE
jgi:hypothetical protein